MTLRYVYGIAPAAAAPAIERAGLAGIDASRVRAIAERELAAVASDLPEEEWRDDVLNERIRDLDWLTPRAASHHDVNARALEIAGALIPLSFGTLYRGDDRVHDAAARQAFEALAAVSERTYREPVARGGPDVVALRLSLLAPKADRAVPQAIARISSDLGRDGYRVHATGPWPPYRFGSLP